jgi:hypothetical protein
MPTHHKHSINGGDLQIIQEETGETSTQINNLTYNYHIKQANHIRSYPVQEGIRIVWVVKPSPNNPILPPTA